LFELEILERDLIALRLEADVSFLNAQLDRVNNHSIHCQRTGVANAANVVNIPLARWLHAILFHLFLQGEALRLAVNWCYAKNVAPARTRLRLVPDRPIFIVAEENAAVVFRSAASDRSEAPLYMESEIANLTIKAKPIVPSIPVADNHVFLRINVPLRNIGRRMVRRNRDSSPLRFGVSREEIDGLSS